jgi:hypothetical protein
VLAVRVEIGFCDFIGQQDSVRVTVGGAWVIGLIIR